MFGHYVIKTKLSFFLQTMSNTVFNKQSIQ